ncbi:hypothetical protein [Psychrobacter lutiphocae]|uniref:hypothetical protein n=1 Tax=Psychrobacter lutiphocae TaxID=540500 RepID=UPI00036BD797|nr:hypothetical protein [Psychrobacter lutiphocae]
MPHTVYALPPIDVPKPQEKILTNGSIFLHESIATVLMQFQLGQTKLRKVDIINILTDEKVTDDVYYYVDLAEKRDYFLAEQSEQVSGNSYDPSIKCKYIRRPQTGDIALKADAAECDVDLWHEPMLRDSWFMSDRLVQALIKAGLTPQQDVDLVQCRLV